MKRYFQKGITAVMTMTLLTSLVACGSKNNTANTGAETDEPTTTEAPTEAAEATEAPTEAAEATEDESPYTVLKDENGNVYDLGGMEIIVADWWTAAEQPEPTTQKEEDTLAYREFIQETYNFKIKQLGIDGWGEHPETFINFATTGGDENYVFQLYQSSLGAPMASGLFYDLSTLDCLDFSEDKWDVATMNLMTKGSSIYGMRPEAPEPRGGIFFNKRLLQEAGVDPESLYDMQADGSWTWDAFDELCAKLTRDTDSDGVNDVYAMTNFSAEYFTSVIASNNAKYFDMDENGNYINVTNSDEFLEALNWGQEMLKKYEMPAPEGAEWNYAFAAFANAEAAMICTEEYKVGEYKSMEDDYGFVMFPKGPNADRYYNVYSDNVAVIPACYDAERAWKIAFAYNLFTNPTPGYEGEDDWKTTFYTVFRDSRAVDETIATMKNPENGVTWYNALIPGLQIGDIVYTAYANEKTATEIVESVKDTWQAFIDEANAKK